MILMPGAYAQGQQSWQPASPTGPSVAQTSPQPQKRTQPAATAKGSDPTGDSGRAGEAQLRQRVEQLEEQLVDMQVLVGTLESLARNTGSAPPSLRAAPALSAGGGDSARIDALETQIRALTAQVEQLADQIRGSGAPGGVAASGPVQREAPPTRLSGLPGPAPTAGFGATVVTPGGSDQIGRIIDEDAAANDQQQPSQLALGAPADGGNPKQAYEMAYGYLLQQNYGAAESAFEEFLRRYPNDALAGNAQFWLGESLFVRGQFKAAASAFLKGYQTYGRSAKAPDSLLRLAMSLDRLGQRDAACSSYQELLSRFPNAPSHVKNRAQTERQRVGC